MQSIVAIGREGLDLGIPIHGNIELPLKCKERSRLEHGFKHGFKHGGVKAPEDTLTHVDRGVRNPTRRRRTSATVAGLEGKELKKPEISEAWTTSSTEDVPSPASATPSASVTARRYYSGGSLGIARDRSGSPGIARDCSRL